MMNMCESEWKCIYLILLMDKILHHLGMVKNPINNGIIILGGAGFCPSTICFQDMSRFFEVASLWLSEFRLAALSDPFWEATHSCCVLLWRIDLLGVTGSFLLGLAWFFRLKIRKTPGKHKIYMSYFWIVFGFPGILRRKFGQFMVDLAWWFAYRKRWGLSTWIFFWWTGPVAGIFGPTRTQRRWTSGQGISVKISQYQWFWLMTELRTLQENLLRPFRKMSWLLPLHGDDLVYCSSYWLHVLEIFLFCIGPNRATPNGTEQQINLLDFPRHVSVLWWMLAW